MNAPPQSMKEKVRKDLEVNGIWPNIVFKKLWQWIHQLGVVKSN